MSPIAKLRLIPFLILIGLLSSAGTTSAANTVLHSFAGAPNDGRNPSGLTLVNNVLYGTAAFGGPNNGQGVVFRMNTDGTGYTILHTFLGGSNDGARPGGKLIVSGSKIYGVTQNGGTNNFGTLYSMDLSGANFVVLHSFAGGVNDGAFPGLSFVLLNGTLYGSAELGGPDNLGVLFKVNTDGSGFTILHGFITGPTDGHLPIGGLTLAGSTLYGTTAQGGTTSNGGTLFKIEPNGTGYTILHSFGAAGDGFNPEKELTPVGNTLFGVTNQGGTAGTGTIFKINTAGTGYSVIYSFESTAGNGGSPSSPLFPLGNRLIGSTDPLHAPIPGLVYSIRDDGSDFVVLYRFNGSNTEGREPGGSFSAMGPNLFGMAQFGGTSGVNGGVIYSLLLPLNITAVNYSPGGSFSLTGQTFSNCPLTIQIFSNLQDDPAESHQISSDSAGNFQFGDMDAASEPNRFYRAVVP